MGVGDTVRVPVALHDRKSSRRRLPRTTGQDSTLTTTTDSSSANLQQAAVQSEPVKKRKASSWQPENWCEQLDNIRTMRSARTAPVDSMGCHMLADRQASPETYRYQCLLSLMLSSQTKDEVTSAAIQRLQQGRGCSADVIHSTPEPELAQILRPTKARHIKAATEILLRDYDGDIPDSVSGLCSLPGVGPKMAHLLMRTAWGKTTGIAVDVHVHRIANRLQWVKKPTSKPTDTQIELESWLPRFLLFDDWTSEVRTVLRSLQ